MTGILVVERSATLRHLLARTLHAAQYSKWSELTAYTDALDHLQQAQRLNQHYRVLLLGAPARATPDFLKLLQFLREPSATPLPVPVEIEGRVPLRAIDYALPKPSAQIKSAVLLAALGAEGTVIVRERTPPRDHTERMLAAFGAAVETADGAVRFAGG